MRGNINRYTFVLSYSKQWRIYLSEAFQRFWERVTHIFSRYPCLAVSASSEFIKFVGHHVDGISIQVHVKTNLICSALLLRPVTKITITHLLIYMNLLFEKKKKNLKKKNHKQTNLQYIIGIQKLPWPKKDSIFFHVNEYCVIISPSIITWLSFFQF